MSDADSVVFSPGVRRFLVVTGVFMFVATASQLTGFVPDPAWASLRYAENIAAGHGPVWNIGGARVEGYSAPLLLGLQVVATVVGVDAMAATQLLGFAASLATLALVHRLGRAQFGALPAALAVLFAGSSPAFALWSVGGTETPLVACVVLFALLDFLGGGALAGGFVLAILPLLRPEGLVLAMTVALAGTIAAPNWRRRLMKAVVPVLAVALIVTAGRGMVFGEAFPNSVRVRFGAADPLAVTTDFVRLVAPALPFAALGAFAAGGVGARLAAAALGLAIAALLTMDSVSAFARHAIPLWPLIALLAARGVPVLVRLRSGATGGILLVVGILMVVTALLGTPEFDVAATKTVEHEFAACRTQVRTNAADWLRPRLGVNGEYAVSDAGEFSLRAGGTSLDLIGLHDPSLAKSGRQTFGVRARWALARAPAWFVLRGKRESQTLTPFYGHERSLVREEAFAANYTLAASFAKAGCDISLWIYQRR